ncbi:MAG: PAS domain S-box protein [Deltaproteobacteria bacterium]|nr:PAS domain S-box protein [Deltaproteobacteria bacterium]
MAVFIILLPITLTFVYGYRKNKEQLKGAVLKEMTVIAEAYEGQVLQHLDVVKKRVAGLSADKTIKALAREAVAGKKGSAGRVASYFISENAEYGVAIETVSLVSPAGKVLASTDPSKTGTDRSDSQSFIEGSRKAALVEENNGSGVTDIVFSVPLRDEASGGLLGVVTATVPFTDLNRLLSGESNKELGALSWSKGRHETMEVYLVNRDRVMLTDSIFIKDAAMRQKVATDPVGKCLDEGVEMTGFYRDYRGVEVAGASMCFPGLGWTLLVETDESEVVRPAEEMLKSAVIAAGIVIVLIIGLYLLIIRKMVKRVGTISRAAGEIASGNYDVALPVKSLDEIGELNMAFNRMARDIRERNAEILMEKDRARSYLDLAGVVIVAIGLDRRVKLINRKGCELLGLPAGDIIGSDWFENFIPANVRAKLGGFFVMYVNGEIKGDYYENEIMASDGSLRMVAWHNTLLKDPSGAVIGTLSSGEDITERRRAEEALRVSERKYRTILEESRDVIFVATPDLRLMDLNPVAEEVFGYRLPELVGKSLEGFFIEEGDRERLKGELGEKGEVKGFDARVRKKDGQEIWLSISARRVEETGGGPVCRGILRDITRHKHLEAQLLQAQKMEAIGQLTGGIAHDFNNILTAIMSSAGLLELMLPMGSRQMNYVRQIVSSSERASKLTRGLLAFSRKTLVELKSVRVNEIIRNMEKLLSRLIGEDIDFKVSLTDADPVVTADVSQIEQVLMNLATNARDAMPSGGALSIVTETITLAPESLKEKGYMLPGEYALITVSDTGEGMERKVAERIFDPFFTTKEVGKGTGLGLAIVYGIMKQHNGYVDVYSELGVGTQFKLYLPLAGIKAEDEAEIRSEAQVGGTETILLAEDDAEVRNLIKALLEEFGYTVVEAVNGEDAVRQYAVLGKEVDMLVLDMIMPRMNGKEAFGEIRKMNPSVRALFLSGYSQDFINQKVILEEGLNFYVKPVSASGLLKRVREVLDRK